VEVGRTPRLGSSTDVYRFPDPPVHSVAFSVNHLGAILVYDVVERDSVVCVTATPGGHFVPTKAALVAETSTTTMYIKVVI